jgi:hypothetical protein
MEGNSIITILHVEGLRRTKDNHQVGGACADIRSKSLQNKKQTCQHWTQMLCDSDLAYHFCAPWED